ncbi:MAG: transketolase [Robiginitomaculum sp.]
MTKVSQIEMANAIRSLSMDAVQAANSGHPGMPMGMADVATVLFDKFLKFNPSDPHWHDRDRFILSAGHGSMLIYSLLHLTGYKAVSMEQIKNFRQLGSITAGHPEYGHCPGVETTTGPLGQGIANGVGFALAERHMNAKYGDELVDHYTYVMAGDGCLMEGISQEAIAMAGHLKLNKLILLWDDNNITIDGAVELSDSTDQAKRFQACGWKTIAVDGHDTAKVARAIRSAQRSDKPTLIACKTIIGKGAPTKAGTSGVHGAPLGADEIKGAKAALGIDYPAFEIPTDIYDAWKKGPRRGRKAHRAWKAAMATSGAKGDALNFDMSGALGEGYKADMAAYKQGLAKDMPKLATRASSGNALKVLTKAIPTMISGSADLEGSNKTRTPSTVPEISASEYGGRYINYGIREHGMAAAMNGMALHGGMIPYSGTFLVFADYCRPSIRLAGLMNTRVIHVMTHDSIGVGEDGPTHQPVEHVASLRAIPNVNVYRPADAMETAECWELAIARDTGPSIMALTRQGVPAVRDNAGDNMCARGGYVLRAGAGADQIVLIASGSEVHKAVLAHERLAKEGISARVVSMPCMDVFKAQSVSYQRSVLGKKLPKIAIEAGIKMGWGSLIGIEGGFIGMDSFGASAPGEALFEHFGITTDAIVTMAKEMV